MEVKCPCSEMNNIEKEIMYYYWSEEITKSDCEKIINEFDTSKSVDATTGNYQKTLYPEEIEEYKKNGNWDFDKNQPKNINTPDESTRKTKLNWLPLRNKFNKILSEYVTRAIQ